eukprot:496198_1
MGTEACSMNDIECPCTPHFGDKKPSKKDVKWIYDIKNDYELAIRLSKELEYVLELHFNATGRGLHQKITTAQNNYNATYSKQNQLFPTDLIRNMRRLATIRNKLIHNRFYNKIDDKNGFLHTFEDSYVALQCIVIKMSRKGKKSKNEECIIL